MRRIQLSICIVISVLSFTCLGDIAEANQIKSITIVATDDASTRVATVLKRRILKRSAVNIGIAGQLTETANYTILLGQAQKSGMIDTACAAHAVNLPGKSRPATRLQLPFSSRRKSSLATLPEKGANHSRP